MPESEWLWLTPMPESEWLWLTPMPECEVAGGGTKKLTSQSHDHHHHRTNNATTSGCYLYKDLHATKRNHVQPESIIVTGRTMHKHAQPHQPQSTFTLRYFDSGDWEQC
ncbi:hypothetical protein RRG08_014088 [Elysia crispata]|uniref:Uncharacterized protein n=1 Tax=Elysia crispata TaxID=231223 RepID=A0AAE1E5D0_9GAST|nr:hypothetical protein RRG08_014088 [Elysia crispata]